MPTLVASGLTEAEFALVVAEESPLHRRDGPAASAAALGRGAGVDRFNVKEYRPNCCCPFDTPEAAGVVLVMSLVTATAVMSSVLLSAAVLELATREAGCGYIYNGDDDAPPSCRGKVYGQRPANLFFICYTAAAAFSAVLNPALGAVVDHTPYRKHVAMGRRASYLSHSLRRPSPSAEGRAGSPRRSSR